MSAADSGPAGPTWIYLALALVALIAVVLLVLLLGRGRATRLLTGPQS